MVIIHIMKLNFFFDIDGTLVPFGQHVPESAIKALLKAKSEGHRLFLSTGRASFEVLKELWEIPFDGGVFSAGAELMVDSKRFFRAQANEEQRKLFWNVVDKYDLLWLVQGNSNTFARKRAMDYYRELSFSVNGNAVNLEGTAFVDSYPENEPMVKFYIMSEKGLVLEARKDLDGLFDSVNNTTGLPEEAAAEVMLAGISKASGIKRMMDYLGEDISSTVGIGDGENDLEMVDTCRMGIAMGNSCKVLKDHADFVTDDIYKDGLAKAIYHAMDTLG